MDQISPEEKIQWVEKIIHNGVEALQDRRGKRKSQDEMDELEKLRAEVNFIPEKNSFRQLRNIWITIQMTVRSMDAKSLQR